MVYLVCGFPRSGTSMLMRALEAGGLPCVYSTAGDANRNRNTLIEGYVPNPHGFYEDAPIHRPDWSAFEGKCVKLIRDNFDCIPSPTPSLRAVYLHRDPAEIRRSYIGILSGPRPESVFDFLDGYEGNVVADMARLTELGAEPSLMNYADVVAYPARQFSRLSAAGWPIDPIFAAATVDPGLYRHRGAA